MNALGMEARKTSYVLEIHQLARPYRSADSLQNATRLHSYESVAPFGNFHVGDTFSDTHPTKYLGRIQHIHHGLGQEGRDLIHRTVLYVFGDA
jgi:hypothetical protein